MSCSFCKNINVTMSFTTCFATILQMLQGSQAPELQGCNSSKPRRYAVRRCCLNLRFGEQLKIGEEHKGRCHIGQNNRCCQHSWLRCPAVTFCCSKSPYRLLTSAGFQHTNVKIWNCSPLKRTVMSKSNRFICPCVTDFFMLKNILSST